MNKTTRTKFTGLKSLEDSFVDKTTENFNNTLNVPKTPLPVVNDTTNIISDVTKENKDGNKKNNTIQPKITVQTEQNQPLIQHSYDSFESFINKNFEWKDAEQMNVNRDIKRILEKLASFRKDTTQVSLVSNILKAWIDEHKSEIQKLFKENSRIDF